MNEQRRQILQMLAEGKITADEAERLIAALEREPSDALPADAPRPKSRPKYLRVLLNDSTGGNSPTRINIRVPLQLLRAGVRLTSLVPPQALGQINGALERSGVPIDLTLLKPQDIEELVDQLDDVSIDLDDPGSKIQIFCE
ncbi:MAG TPA: hypothetical protein VGM10_07255 [Actinocrinis sp.]|jgi:hypothetical protein